MRRRAASLRRAVRRAAIAAGKAFADNTPGGTSLETFRDIQPLWTKDGALEVETLRATPEAYDFNVRRCRYAETYKKMGLGEIGALALLQPRRRLLRGLRRAPQIDPHADDHGRRGSLRLPIPPGNEAGLREMTAN